MLENIAKYLKGYLKIRITGYSPERFLNLCKNKGISVWELQSVGKGYEMYISISGFRSLKPILRKTRTKVTILERFGAPFFFHQYRKRKLFFMGILLCTSLIFLLSRFVWRIDIVGNQSITDEMLIEYLAQEEVYHSMKISKVDCERIATSIRQDFQEIIWVSVSIDGTNLTIHVKENTDTFQVSQTEEEPSDIIADADGVITEIITRQGVPCVGVGTEVKQGDLLVSGTVEVINDAGEVIREEYKASDADIYAEMDIAYEDFCETIYQQKVYTSEVKRTLFVKFFDYYLGIGNQKYDTKNFEIGGTESSIYINENFKLPISFGEIKGIGYQLAKKEYTREEMQAILSHNFERYCKELEEEGTTILEEHVQFYDDPEGIRAKGYLKVVRAIGTTRKRIDF